jgi:DnaJ-class molecular chaperone
MIKAKEEITFPRGIDNGATLRFKGKGHLEADLIVKVAVRKHPLFRR